MATVQELSSKYGPQLSQLKSIFPSWDQGDLAFTLQDAKGNVDEAAMMITEGRASQFTEATRKKSIKATPQGGHGRLTNRNADNGGWEKVNGDVEFRGGRGGRGARGGGRGGRGGRGGGDSFRGGRGGRGGFRGRGGFAQANGTGPKKDGALPTSTATTTEGWANQVEQATSAEASATDDGGWSTAADAASTVKGGDDAGWAEGSTPPASSKQDEFAASGGFGDAPSSKEISKAAKGVQSTPAVKPKMTWAQIAKPQDKPKPVPPPPAPVSVPSEPVSAPSQPLTEARLEALEAMADAPPAEQAATETALEIPSTETYVNGVTEDVPEDTAEAATADVWQHDPAIASSGAQPDWNAEPMNSAPTAPVPVAPEPVTTYTGPPGFNPTSPAKTMAAAVAASSPQVRTNSRAGRYKNADGQGVVLPAMVSGLSSMEMQFGSLSFGTQAGDGVEAPEVPLETKPEPKSETPAQAPTALPTSVTSPRGQATAQQPPMTTPQIQPAAPPQVAPPSQTNGTAYPYYGQQQSQPQQPHPASQTQSPPQQQTYQPPSQTLQAQMSSYGSQYGSQTASNEQPPAPYRSSQDPYSAYGQQASSQASAQPQQLHSTENLHQTQQQHQQPSYDAYGQSQGYGAPQQQAQHQSNEYTGNRYDAYNAGYGRSGLEDSKTSSTGAHTPGTTGQPQQSYYSQMNNMGYYQAAPYNPYYQYGQAPQPGFQQYYPLATRGVYNHPSPGAPPAQIPQANKPAPAPNHSPYGQPPSFPSSTGLDEQNHLGLGAATAGGRFGESKLQSPNPPQPTYSSQGTNLHSYLNMNQSAVAPSSTGSQRPGATPDDGYKSQSGQSQASAAAGRPGQQTPSQAQPGPQQQGQQPHQGQHQGYSYPYGGGGYGNQDWSQYGHYGSRNGYSQWQQ